MSYVKGYADLQLDLQVSGEAWKPTPHGEFLAVALSKYDFVSNREILELGAGVAIHSIPILKKNPKHLTMTEITNELVGVIKENVNRNGSWNNVSYLTADWLYVDGNYDVVITNPPFCKSGKVNRRYFIDSLILDSHKRLRANGELVFIQSSMANIPLTEEMLKRNGYRHEIIEQVSGPFREYYFEDKTFMEEIKSVPNGYEVRDGEYIETLSVIHAKLNN